jgi:GT2 family glycosyltransferase
MAPKAPRVLFHAQTMAELPFASVVVPCHNAAPYIATTLRAILAQDGVALDVVVVDDGSTDGSADLVSKQFPQVRVIRQANAGVAAARNAGLHAGRADWVAFCDADDLWLPGKLAAQFELLGTHPSARMAYTAWHVWHSQAAEPDAAWLARLSGTDQLQAGQGASGWIYPELLMDCVVWTSTVLARRDLLLGLGGFDENLRVGEDYDLWLRASRQTPILRVPRPYALYRIHAHNTTRRAPTANHKARVVERALAQWGYTAPDGRIADRRAVAAGLARSWSDFAGAQLGAGDPRAARQSAWKAVRIHPGRWLGWQVLLQASARALLVR